MKLFSEQLWLLKFYYLNKGCKWLLSLTQCWPSHTQEQWPCSSLQSQGLWNIHICKLLCLHQHVTPHVSPFSFSDQILTGFGFSLALHFFKCFASWSSYTVLHLKRKLLKIRLVTMTVSSREKSLSDPVLTVSDLKDTGFFSEHFLPSKEKGHSWIKYQIHCLQVLDLTSV